MAITPTPCLVEGTPGYKHGENGTCFLYNPGDAESRKLAWNKAQREGDEAQKSIKKSLYRNDILKSVEGTHTIVFVILVPGETDRNGDIITEDEVTATAHEFMINITSKRVNVDHEPNTDIKTAQYVESYIAPVDIERPIGTIPAGSWLVGIKFDPALYEQILGGEYVGVSLEGTGVYEELDI